MKCACKYEIRVSQSIIHKRWEQKILATILHFNQSFLPFKVLDFYSHSHKFQTQVKNVTYGYAYTSADALQYEKYKFFRTVSICSLSFKEVLIFGYDLPTVMKKKRPMQKLKSIWLAKNIFNLQ